jgi:hypothetical protein
MFPSARHTCLKITCLKTGSYAVMHLLVAIAVAYALTGDWRAALAIGIIEPIVCTIGHGAGAAWCMATWRMAAPLRRPPSWRADAATTKAAPRKGAACRLA